MTALSVFAPPLSPATRSGMPPGVRGSPHSCCMTLSVVLGVLTTQRVATGWWPRFASQALHRNVSLLAVALLLTHILTTLLDNYVAISWWAGDRPLHVRLQPALDRARHPGPRPHSGRHPEQPGPIGSRASVMAPAALVVLRRVAARTDPLPQLRHRRSGAVEPGHRRNQHGGRGGGGLRSALCRDATRPDVLMGQR